MVFQKETSGVTYNPIMEAGDPYFRKSKNPEGYGSGKNSHGYGFGNKKMMENSNSGTRYPKKAYFTLLEIFLLNKRYILLRNPPTSLIG